MRHTLPLFALLTACTAPVGTVGDQNILLGAGTFYTYTLGEGDQAVNYLGVAFSDAEDTCAAHADLQEAQFAVYRNASLSFDERNDALGEAWAGVFPTPSWYLTLTVALDVDDDLADASFEPAGPQGVTIAKGAFYGNLRHLLMPLDAQYFYDYNVQGQDAVADHVQDYIATAGTWDVAVDGDTLTGTLSTDLVTFGGGDTGSIELPMTLSHCDPAASVYAANP